jgi:hypothetical protein
MGISIVRCQMGMEDFYNYGICQPNDLSYYFWDLREG